MSRLYDAFRVLTGVSIVAKSSYMQYAKQSRHAASHLTIYPASPFHGVSTVAQEAAKTFGKVVHASFDQQSNQHHQQQPFASEINFSELSPDPTVADFQPIVYYNNFGNATPSVNEFFSHSTGTGSVVSVDGIPVKQEKQTISVTTPPLTVDTTPNIDQFPRGDTEAIIPDEPTQLPHPKFETVDHPPPPPATSTFAEEIKERAIPSTSIGRASHFAGLGAKLMYGTISEVFKRTFTSAGNEPKSPYSAVVNEHNAEALADALCKMRGAALKLGQMLSIQDESVVPPVIQKALHKVRQAAYVMPLWQLEGVLVEDLGADWESHFLQFDRKPVAAASIGQVHKAVLKDGRQVAVKIQYPKVKDSIDSDIKNLMNLVTYTNLLPRGAYIADTMKQARKELHLECDYEREAEYQRRFKQLIAKSTEEENLRITIEGAKSIFDPPMSSFYVPDVVSELSTKRVLTTEWVDGRSIDNVASMDVGTRARVARLLLKLCLKELFEFRFMQTDPNWANFFYEGPNQLNLIDFGACLEFPKHFVDEYIRVVYASATKDKETIIDASIKMGFLTGDETADMKDAHARAAMIVGEPFAKPGIYNFKQHAMPEKVGQTIPTMLKGRLTPPPPVTYSLHRKLSGAFLLCYKLGASIECQDIFQDIYERYQEELEQERLSLKQQ